MLEILKPEVVAWDVFQDTGQMNQKIKLYYRGRIQLSPLLPLLGGLYIDLQFLRACLLQDLNTKKPKITLVAKD